MNKKSIGAFGEKLAEDYIINLGYQIIERNATVRWGEIDLIATKNKNLVFFEVKYSRSTILAEELFTRRKRLHLIRTITCYLAKNKIYDAYSKYLGLVTINSHSISNLFRIYMEGLY